ncbi:MAG: carboxypeptidase regulatory-like domain-containing protein [Deltaproteobacteria bacterium]|nr:carboxypeptidase regulatory-like domain-containing protein [Deltaproteobacteria bacterium]
MTSSVKRTFAIAGVLAAIAIAWWLWSRGGSPTEPVAGGGSSGEVLTSTTHGPDGVVAMNRKPPAWFVGRGAPRRVAGRVSLDGAPVEGAVVSLHSALTKTGLAPLVTRRTGADGTFDFGAVAVAQYSVSAEAPDLVPAFSVIDLADPTLKPPPDQLEMRLRACRAFVAGTVYDAANAPIAKAKVLYGGFAGATTDAKGAYKVCLPLGEVMLEYSAEGYGGVTLAMFVLGEHQQDIVLVPEATLTVKVLRADGDHPVPDALVWLAPAEWGRDRATGATAITDADGKAKVDGLVPGSYRIGAFADGLGWENTVIALAEVGKANEATIRLAAMARITGIVKNGTAPVAGAQVFAIRKSPVARSQPSMSAADGTFVLERVPVGDTVFSAYPYEVKKPAGFKVERAQTYDGIVLDVGTLGSIRGRVTRLGKPVVGVSVCCVRTASFEPGRTTDADGKYEFVGVAAGEYELYAETTDIGAFAHPSKVTLGDNEDRTVDIELDQAGAIAGVVVDKEGKPVPGVHVRWTHEVTGDQGRAMTDARGKYRAGAMTGGGKYRSGVYATATSTTPYPTADGAPYPSLEVKDAATTLEDVRLAIAYQHLPIRGRVVDTNGAGIADASVKALQARPNQPAQFNPWMKLPITFTDADGNFALQGLSPGEYALQARSVDGGEGVAPSVAAGATGATIVVARPGAIEGTLTGFPSKPVVYARMLDSAGRFVPGDVEGAASYRVRGLRAGRYLVGAQTTFEGEAQIVEVKPGATVQLPLVARGRGAIDATVLDFRTKTPLPEAVCHVVAAAGGVHSVTNWDPGGLPRSDPRGKLTLDPAPAGNVTIECFMSSFRWSPPSLDLTLAAGTRATVQLYSVELLAQYTGATGLDFDFAVTAPRVAHVRPNGAAARAGVLPGDLIVAVDGTSVDGLNADGVRHLIFSHAIGSDVTLGVLRGGDKKTLTMRIDPDGAQ